MRLLGQIGWKDFTSRTFTAPVLVKYQKTITDNPQTVFYTAIYRFHYNQITFRCKCPRLTIRTVVFKYLILTYNKRQLYVIYYFKLLFNIYEVWLLEIAFGMRILYCLTWSSLQLKSRSILLSVPDSIIIIIIDAVIMYSELQIWLQQQCSVIKGNI